MSDSLLRELLISNWRKPTFQISLPAKISNFFFPGSLLSKMTTSFWEPCFSVLPLLSRTPGTTQSMCRSTLSDQPPNWWLSHTSLLLEDLGCATLVQSRFYQNLPVCTGSNAVAGFCLRVQKFWFQLLLLHISYLQPVNVYSLSSFFHLQQLGRIIC